MDYKPPSCCVQGCIKSLKIKSKEKEWGGKWFIRQSVNRSTKYDQRTMNKQGGYGGRGTSYNCSAGKCFKSSGNLKPCWFVNRLIIYLDNVPEKFKCKEHIEKPVPETSPKVS